MQHHTTLGVLAHVDAGKTTLSEAILYQTGAIRSAGRVDHGDTHLDTDRMERVRGITIFSKMARFSCARTDAGAGAASTLHVTLLDTPGHVDFSAETERTLQVLDYALLIISGPDGVQGHTRTLWRLLRSYGIPTFLFVNKMDLTERSRGEILQELRRDLDSGAVDFTLEDTAWAEEIATCDESLLDTYMEEETLPVSAVRAAIAERKLFPVWFGSALRMEGVTELIAGLGKWMADYRELVSIYGKMSHPARTPGSPDPVGTSDVKMSHSVRTPGSPDPEEETARKEKGRIPSEAGVTGREDGPFAARVFKVGRDRTGGKLTYLKVLSGTLHVKDIVPYTTADGTEYAEKVDQIRLYSGDRFETVQAAGPGEVAAVTGLTMTRPGMGAGAVQETVQPVLMPVMTRAMVLPPDQSAAAFYRKVKELAEEDPSLRLTWNAKTGEIRAEVMGNVQIEVLTHMIEERFGVRVTFGPEQILYKETIAAPVRGIGHFEPLRHYAEVQLLLEPGGRGSGITTASACSEDVLALNWQRLILTHVLEREHIGVLTGAPVTDLKVTVLTGKAHIKHTEGGDFRQATYRAIRQGLMCAQNVLLEPYYSFLLDIPADTVGRAMTDLTARFAEMSPPEISDDGMRARLSGKAPVAAISDYMTEVHAYTKGTGSLSLVPEGYGPCHNPEEVLAASRYDPELDAENPSASVFCSHGAGVLVPWDEVAHFAHCDAEGGPAFGAADGDAEAGFLEDGEELRTYEARERVKRGKTEEVPPEEDPELTAIYRREFNMTQDGIRTDAEMRNRRGWNRRPLSDGTAHGAGSGSGGSGGMAEGPRAAQGGKPGKYRKRSDDAASPVKKDKKGNPIYPRKDVRPDYMIVDGYNVIFQWEELRALAGQNIDSARGKLLDVLSNYQGYTGIKMTVVFDAYRTDRTPEAVMGYDNMEVVFTRQGVTADAYIERLVHEKIAQYKITVVTSDALEQLTIMRLGALRMSASMLMEDIARVSRGDL